MAQTLWGTQTPVAERAVRNTCESVPPGKGYEQSHAHPEDGRHPWIIDAASACASVRRADLGLLLRL
jgi:hypothetical protein